MYQILRINCAEKCRKPGGNGPLVKRGNSQDYENDIGLTLIKCDVVDLIHLAHDRIPCLLEVNTTYIM